MTPYKAFQRRGFLAALSVLLAGGVAYSWRRGIRYPMLSLDPHQPDTLLERSGVTLILKDCIVTPSQDQAGLATLRAFAPEPKIELRSKLAREIVLSVNNLAPDAKLSWTALPSHAITETVDGINRVVTIVLEAGESLALDWTLPEIGDYRFAAIGDTGGRQELQWCIQRAHALNARFLLHLGDFNYAPGDYASALEIFASAPLPCYVSVGNHDFHDGGLVYEHFLNNIGPFNHSFTLAGTRFINLDTAASFTPSSGGARGKLLAQLIASQSAPKNTVVFTHRPLTDPTPDSDHDLGNDRERDWLLKQLGRLHVKTMFCGHIHIADRSNVHDVEQIIVGQGLGHQDLLVNRDYSKLALAEVGQNQSLQVSLAPLQMPMNLHCHPRTEFVKQSLRNGPHAETIRRVDSECESTAKKAASAAHKAL